jgi:hypothetical protein
LTAACAATLFLIPTMATDELKVTTRFTTRSSALARTFAPIVQRETIRSWVELVLLPLTPFMFPTIVMSDAYRDLHRATLLEARRQKIF